jgi:hypothetical protein
MSSDLTSFVDDESLERVASYARLSPEYLRTKAKYGANVKQYAIWAVAVGGVAAAVVAGAVYWSRKKKQEEEKK